MSEEDILYCYALDVSGKLWTASKAPRGKYTCLDCHGEMVLRHGDVLTPHFAHLPGEGEGCSGESVEHKASKLLLVASIPLGIQVYYPMCPCGFSHDPFLVKEGSVAKQEVEVGAFRVDVAVYNEDDPTLFIECKRTHAVGSDKGRALSSGTTPWIEVHVLDVLQNTKELYPFNGSRLFTPPRLCDTCVINALREQEEARREIRRQEEVRRLAITIQEAERARVLKEQEYRAKWQLEHAAELVRNMEAREAEERHLSAVREAEERRLRPIREAERLAKLKAEAKGSCWTCVCGAMFDLPRMCCAICGRFSPSPIQIARMKFKWPDSSTHQIWALP